MAISNDIENPESLQVLLDRAHAIKTINQEILDSIQSREGHKIIAQYQYSLHSKPTTTKAANADRGELVTFVNHSSTKNVNDIIAEWRYTGKPLTKETYPRDRFMNLKLETFDDLLQKHNQYSKLLYEYTEMFKDNTKSRIATEVLLQNLELLSETMVEIRTSTLNVVDPPKVNDAMSSLAEGMSKSFQSFQSKMSELDFHIDFQGQMMDNKQTSGSTKLNTHGYNCYRIGTGPAKLGGICICDLDIDVESARKLSLKKDERIKLTRNNTLIDTWRVQTDTYRSYQWVGWRDSYFRNKKVKVVFDVKFARKPADGHCGVKFLGKLVNDWVSQAPLGKWYHVELEETLPGSGDYDHIILIFDGVVVDLELKDFQLYVPK